VLLTPLSGTSIGIPDQIAGIFKDLPKPGFPFLPGGEGTALYRKPPGGGRPGGMRFTGTGMKHPEPPVLIGLPADMKDIIQVHINPVIYFQKHKITPLSILLHLIILKNHGKMRS
jgi:hypothetical protein